jgi:predicted O-methyltransferase YrrM
MLLTGIDQYHASQSDYLNSLVDTYGDSNDSKALINNAVDGAIKLLDALYIRDLIADLKPKKILEIGSFLGFSTKWILDCSSADTPVVSLDPGVRHRIFDNVDDHVRKFCASHSKRHKIIKAYLSEKDMLMFLHDYLKFEPKWEAIEAVKFLDSIKVVDAPFDEFDFAFIDGDHSFSATIKNTHLVSKMMPNGGVIVVHDALSCPDVRPALERLTAASKGGLELMPIAGDSFHQAANRNWDRYGHDQLFTMKQSFCDGLGVIQVKDASLLSDREVNELLQ